MELRDRAGPGEVLLCGGAQGVAAAVRTRFLVEDAAEASRGTLAVGGVRTPALRLLSPLDSSAVGSASVPQPGGGEHASVGVELLGREGETDSLLGMLGGVVASPGALQTRLGNCKLLLFTPWGSARRRYRSCKRI